MTRRLKRIAPLQLGKIMAVLHALMALIFVPFFLGFAAVGTFASGDNSGAGMLAIGGALVMALLMPVMYGVCGFIFGVLGAALYNLVARWVGGIEVEVE